eukprot:9141-Heterococcus_DN1.PRE.2
MHALLTKLSLADISLVKQSEQQLLCPRCIYSACHIRQIYTAPIVRQLAICSIVCMCNVSTALLKVSSALHNEDAMQNTSRHICYI